MRLPLAFAALLLAAILAAVGYVLARPRWRWEPEPTYTEYWRDPDAYSDDQRRAATLGRIREIAEERSATYVNHATAWSAALNTPDDAARWAGG